MSAFKWFNEALEYPERLTWEHWIVIGLLASVFCLFCLKSGKPYG
jgi:hypothetical protein